MPARIMRQGDGDPRHGTPNGYGNLRYRCPECREAWRIDCTERRTQRANAEKGFTLIELLIAIVTLGILGSVVVITIGALGDDENYTTDTTYNRTTEKQDSARIKIQQLNDGTRCAVLDDRYGNPIALDCNWTPR